MSSKDTLYRPSIRALTLAPWIMAWAPLGLEPYLTYLSTHSLDISLLGWVFKTIFSAYSWTGFAIGTCDAVSLSISIWSPSMTFLAPSCLSLLVRFTI